MYSFTLRLACGSSVKAAHPVLEQSSVRGKALEEVEANKCSFNGRLPAGCIIAMLDTSAYSEKIRVNSGFLLTAGCSIPAVRVHGVHADRVQFPAPRWLAPGRVGRCGPIPHRSIASVRKGQNVPSRLICLICSTRKNML